ncbi:folate-binding protein YgfZ [Massilia sp. TS11]|uniref:CAF17-like 4Fe-4S cluster assembly/insertion protein YgfZ n=1 Tax=Massilia sp. TS11 TaxID=2908003 RepID=UPI001EDA8303|nr:folate-binding protein [Massilia sp. TS11]MCG2584706.1 folate-binding protein [Massilia sp. TS11]
MNSWNQFLASSDNTVLPVPALAAGFVAVVNDLGLISVSGDDAASFLHNQLTNDVHHLGPERVRLAGYCTPKGRLLASFLVWRDAEAIYLQLPQALLPAIQKRLSMYVLRAKAKLAALSGRQVLAIGGAAGAAALQGVAGALPAAPYTRLDLPQGPLLRLADAFGAARYQWLVDDTAAPAIWEALSAKLAVGGRQAWQLSQIHAGVPTIEASTQEKFVPQMINLELLGGVDFKKGCYPGQEIVARSQYLGKLKRRAFLAQVASSAAAGDEVFAAADPGQPCGMVVNAAPNGAGGSDLLVELKLDAPDSGPIHLGAAAGPALSLLPMPYALDALDL